MRTDNCLATDSQYSPTPKFQSPIHVSENQMVIHKKSPQESNEILFSINKF